MTQSAPYVISENHSPKTIRYGFFGRQGGVSTDLYDSLNCGMGSDDDIALVRQNRAIAAASLGSDERTMASVYQIHSAEIVTITAPHEIADMQKTGIQKTGRPKADGLVTNQSHITLSILTADCTPVLFWDEANHVIGACHAGWRGAASGVIQNTVKEMQTLGAELESITCIIGPTIAKASYQVGADMRAAVLEVAPQASLFFTPDKTQANHYHFDLPAFAVSCAQAAGLSDICDLGIDTYNESAHYFSHRRATHQGLADTGRQVSLITQSRHDR